VEGIISHFVSATLLNSWLKSCNKDLPQKEGHQASAETSGSLKQTYSVFFAIQLLHLEPGPSLPVCTVMKMPVLV